MYTADDIMKFSDDEISSILTNALHKLLSNTDLNTDEMTAVMLIIMQGRCPDALMGAILVALRQKGESIDEIAACAKTMIELADTININDDKAVDIVGTGGDGQNLFNISTAAAFVAAAAGVTIAKHGNRGVSTSSGSSDVLSMAGVKLDIDINHTRDGINELGVGFLFAPNHHPAMRHAVGVRRQLKVRTIFNVLGPLTNPALVKRAVIGVFDASLCEPLAQVLANLGYQHALVVHSSDGLDEYSIAGNTQVAELKDGQISTYHTAPTDVGIQIQSLQGLQVPSSKASLDIIQAALAGDSDDPIITKAQAIIAINAGAAIYVSGQADSHQAGVAKAFEVLASGQALDKLQAFAKFTQQF